MGRFTQMDTWGGNNHDPVTLHKYLYANVDPGNMVDPTGNFSIGSVMAGVNINATLTTLSVASSAFNLYSASTDEDGLTAKEVGLSVLIAAAGPAGGKLINLLVKGNKAKKALSTLEIASEASFKAAKSIKSWVPKNKHLKTTSSKGKARFDTDDIKQVRNWTQEALRSPRATFLPNGSSTDSFRVVVDMGREIGVKGQRLIRVVVTDKGKIINAFPVHTR